MLPPLGPFLGFVFIFVFVFLQMTSFVVAFLVWNQRETVRVSFPEIPLHLSGLGKGWAKSPSLLCPRTGNREGYALEGKQSMISKRKMNKC